ncbi:MAG: response regulator [Ferruginibacter sp.]
MENNFMLHILLIDDDEDDKELFRAAFKEVAPESVVSTANSIDELLKNIDSLNSELPDIIFLDLSMPKMDGFECLDLIKSINPLNNIPVFIYSTSVNPAHLELTYEKGASRYFQKPNSFDGIKSLITRMLLMAPESYLPQTKWDDFLMKTSAMAEN